MKALIAAAWHDKTQTLSAWAEEASAGAGPAYEDLALVGNLGDAMARYCEAQNPSLLSEGHKPRASEDTSPHQALQAPEGDRRSNKARAGARSRRPQGVTETMFAINDSRVRMRDVDKTDTQAFVDRLPSSASPSAKAWLNAAIGPHSSGKNKELRWIRLLLGRGEIGQAYVYAADLPAPRVPGAAPPKASWPSPRVGRTQRRAAQA